MPDFSRVFRDLHHYIAGTCPACNGMGWTERGFWLWKKAPKCCSRCHGTGRYSEDNKETVEAFLKRE